MFDLEFLFTSLSISHSNNLTRNNINRTLTINGFIVLSLKKSLSFITVLFVKRYHHNFYTLYIFIFSSSPSYYSSISSARIKLYFFIHSTYDCFLKKYLIVDYNIMLVWWRSITVYMRTSLYLHTKKKLFLQFIFTSVFLDYFFRWVNFSSTAKMKYIGWWLGYNFIWNKKNRWFLTFCSDLWIKITHKNNSLVEGRKWMVLSSPIHYSKCFVEKVDFFLHFTILMSA